MKNLATLVKADKKNLVTKKDGSLTKRTVEAIQYVLTNELHCQFYAGSGRHVRVVSYFSEIKTVLTLLKYSVDFINDAPRGGASGLKYKLSKQAINTLQLLVN
jgi:hypothetical protein